MDDGKLLSKQIHTVNISIGTQGFESFATLSFVSKDFHTETTVCVVGTQQMLSSYKLDHREDNSYWAVPDVEFCDPFL